MAATVITVPASNGYSDAKEYEGGAALWIVTGTFDGGTVTLQVSYDDGATWRDASSVNDDVTGTRSSDGGEMVWFGGAPLVRVQLSNSSGSTDVECSLQYGVARVMYEGAMTIVSDTAVMEVT